METVNELPMKKGKINKSPTRFPKRMPTYVVAFAVQETLDDPHTIQQITNKRNSENNSPSISPTESNNSAKTFIITPTEQIPSICDIPTLSEVKIDILDENQCGDVVEKNTPQMNSFILLDDRTAYSGQPEILFNAPKHTKKYKDSTRFASRRPRKSKRVINFKNVHFKYKKPKNSITRRLEKYYEKQKSNMPNCDQIQNQMCCNVLSKVVSRSRVLRKVLARENLLADSDRISTVDDGSIFDYDDESMNSSPSSTKKSFISYTSQKTLVQKNSETSRNEDFSSFKTANSIITMTSERHSPYKPETFNVSLAVAYDASKTSTNLTTASSNETLMHKENLTSSEILEQNNTELTSKLPSTDEPIYKIDYDELTLTPMTMNEKVQNNEDQGIKSDLEVRSEDGTFVIAKTSSDFNKSSLHSDCTLTVNSESTLPNENAQSDFPSNDDFANSFSDKTTLLDKVKLLGFCPTKTPSVGSSANLCCDLNDILVTNSNIMTNTIPLTSISIIDDNPTDTQKASVLRKPVDLSNMTYLQTNISLPNDVAIKAKLKEVEEARRSCPDSIRNKYPTDLAEMWERLTIVLDFAVKRLEDTLADKIIKEIRESLATFNQPECKTQIEIQRVETTVAPVTCDRPIPTMLHKEIFVKEDHIKQDADMCVQCDLVQRHVIDELMAKLSAEKPIPSATEVLHPSQLLKDHLEVLKPPVELAKESASIEAGKVDTVTVSTATTALSSISHNFVYKRLIEIPAAFLRENTYVIAGVPTFFIVIICIYGIMMLILNP